MKPDGTGTSAILKDGRVVARIVVDKSKSFNVVEGAVPIGEPIYEYFPNGKIEAVNFGYNADGLDQLCRRTVYYPSGKPKITANGKNCYERQLVKTYDEDGHLIRDEILTGLQKEETEHEYDSNGLVKTVRHYIHGKLDGLSAKYSRAGKLEKEENYVDGVLSGVSRTYFEDGKTVSQYSLYKTGVLVLKEEYDRSGKVLSRR